MAKKPLPVGKGFWKGLTPSQQRTITKRFGAPVRFLGRGTLADAYLSSKGLVLKFTQDPSDAAFSMKVKGRNLPHVVKVYDVMQIHKTTPQCDTIWLVVTERVTLVDNDIQEFNQLGHWYSICGLGTAVTLDQMAHTLDRLRRIQPKPGMVGLHGQYVELLDELLKLGLAAHDIGPWNLGWRDHELVVFDLGGDIEVSSPEAEILRNPERKARR